MKNLVKPEYYILYLIAGLIILAIEFIVPGQRGSLLLTLSYWVALTHGCIALVAAADIAKARWIVPLRRNLLSVYPLLLLYSILFLFLISEIDIYPWAKKEGVWLNRTFFITRNFLLLFLSFLSAYKFSKESLIDGERKNIYGSIYIAFFVASQSMIAFDWIMPLEYPWYSTLFGGYFFIESIYSGIAISAIISFFLIRNRKTEKEGLTGTLRDISTLTFGFSLLWAGLFYAQFLVIWYGNIPEEVSFLFTRIKSSPFKEISYTILPSLFFFPFLTLLSRKTKVIPSVVSIISILILSGIFMERLLFILPKVDLNIPKAIIQSIIMVALMILTIRNYS